MRDIDVNIWHRHAWQNRLQSILLLLFMGVFLALLGWFIWGESGVVMLLLLGLVSVLFNPRFSPAMVMKLYGAQPLTPRLAPQLYAVVIELSRRAALSNIPTLYYVPSRIINAFTVGHNVRSAIAVTDGLLRTLDLREQVGVLGHEISHIRNGDTWVMGLADTFSRMTSVLALLGALLLLLNMPLIWLGQVSINWLTIIVLLIAPSLSALAQLGLSRTREFDADLNAVRLTGDPVGLSRALVKIENMQSHWLARVLLPGHGLPEPSLLRTHPPTQERVQRLLQLQTEQARQMRPFAQMNQSMDALRNELLVTRQPRWRMSGLWY